MNLIEPTVASMNLGQSWVPVIERLHDNVVNQNTKIVCVTPADDTVMDLAISLMRIDLNETDQDVLLSIMAFGLQHAHITLASIAKELQMNYSAFLLSIQRMINAGYVFKKKEGIKITYTFYLTKNGADDKKLASVLNAARNVLKREQEERVRLADKYLDLKSENGQFKFA